MLSSQTTLNEADPHSFRAMSSAVKQGANGAGGITIMASRQNGEVARQSAAPTTSISYQPSPPGSPVIARDRPYEVCFGVVGASYLTYYGLYRSMNRR